MRRCLSVADQSRVTTRHPDQNYESLYPILYQPSLACRQHESPYLSLLESRVTPRRGVKTWSATLRGRWSGECYLRYAKLSNNCTKYTANAGPDNSIYVGGVRPPSDNEDLIWTRDTHTGCCPAAWLLGPLGLFRIIIIIKLYTRPPSLPRPPLYIPTPPLNPLPHTIIS